MKSDKSVVLLDDHGGMLSPLTRRMNDKDVLFAITFNPYAEETSQLIDDACKKNVPIVCITDNQMTPHGSKMDVCFEVQEGELMGFRSLSSSMYLAQAIAVSLICREVK
ncbi:predicted transcriptional regulator of the myo-inositol catabolic operon [Vibrio sp. JCM 19052]|nr:predicted transcriptional regulator of the myo-inositol catabolic operon [Vibrio sp. JCM 19052]